MGLTLVPRGQIATIVTSLEMRDRPPPRPLAPAPLRLRRWTAPAADRYRVLFRRVGAPWLWFSRLAMADPALLAIIHDARLEIFAVEDRAGIEVGLLELDYRESATCELSFLGLIPELTGKGLGHWLMGQALMLGWRKGIERLWVHTCSIDHPGALCFYRRHGFVPFAQSIETFADPRQAGLLPADSAPHVPLLAPDRPGSR